MKSRESAIILACLSVCFGGIGFHKFYLGQFGSFFLYLLFMFTTIPFFLSIGDLIVLVGMDQHRFNVIYNYDFLDRLRDDQDRTESLLNAPRRQAWNDQSRFSRTDSSQSSNSKVQELKELRKLLVEGAISEQDYEALKNDILKR